MVFSPIYFTNSLSQDRELFQPLSERKVSIYSCGPTVYDASHIGHARSFIVWDVLVRFLRLAGYEVVWVRNLTDIDDKIINRAGELGITPEKLARIETCRFWNDMCSLNVDWPQYEPRATENLAQMFEFIRRLIDCGFAYQAQNGDIYFRVSKLTNYGQLKALSEDNRALARVLHSECKEHKNDFALWKAFPPHEIGYISPFGYGRPGWHLECSSMIDTFLGETIDIHTGGDDLIFPHHENEIAQSESLHGGKKLANYWLHNGMLLIDGRKMSKSERNYITIREALSQFSANALRFFVLSGHYRQTLNYTCEGLEGAEKGFQRLLQSCTETGADSKKPETLKEDLPEDLISSFLACLADDLNTPKTLAFLFEIAHRINKGETKLKNFLQFGLENLGFCLVVKQSQNQASEMAQKFSRVLMKLRDQARQEKNFPLSDQIRDLLRQEGFSIKDTAQGSEICSLTNERGN
ncbi:MAG: cysteine--tRNA ligase [Candidatus Caenarcaniphilales bacterium]|nr:cysteine--tRNA ligase [Candidatus Caenarcaniphilales bacterium]